MQYHGSIRHCCSKESSKELDNIEVRSISGTFRRQEFEATEKSLTVKIIEPGKPRFVDSKSMQSMLLDAIDCCPHGVNRKVD
jgi:hypothetical protein